MIQFLTQAAKYLMSKIAPNLKEKQDGAVYWLEIAAGIFVVVIIIVVINNNQTAWTGLVTTMNTAISNLLKSVTGYWGTAT